MKKQDGFSLIEIAIGLTVIGLLIGAFMQGQKAYRQEKIRASDRTVQEKITSSLSIFLQQNGHYPCPAAPNLGFSHTNFGRSVACGGTVAQGALPVRDLNLPLEMMADTYGSKLTYAVTTARTNSATYNTATDAITIVNSTGTTKPAPFVIVSHGPDKKGAYPLTGTTITIPCGSAARDSENCNGNATFRDGLYSPSPDINDSNRYDDTLTYSLAQRATTLWLLAPNATGLNIANRNTGNVGIGTSTPDTKLNVHNGDLNVDDAGASASGDIMASGKMEANNGSRIHAKKTINATGNIYVKDRAQAAGRITAERFCYNIDINTCN